MRIWIIHHLQVLGEAAARVNTDERTSLPEIPWQGIVSMRNLLVHEYFGIDLDEVWTTVMRDLPPLAVDLSRALAARE